MLPVRSAMARDNSRIACWPFVNEYKLHKLVIRRKTPPERSGREVGSALAWRTPE
jgi:hypothetical protein